MPPWATRSAGSQAGLRLIPVPEGANGDLVFQQGSRSRRGKAARTCFAVRVQEAICRGCTHREEVAPALFAEMEMPMPLQYFDKRGQERDQSFGANVVGRCPCQVQRPLNLCSVVRWTWAVECLLHLRRMVEEMNGILTGIAGDGNETIEYTDLLGTRRLVILGR
jgi:hypothetical protein